MSGIGLLSIAACAGAVWLTAATVVIGVNSAIVDNPGVFVTLRAVGCVGLVVVALLALARGFAGRMVAALLALSYVLALTGLTGADSPLPFAIGRIAVPLAILAAMYVCFAYPTGRIVDRGASVVLASSAAVLTALLAANLLLSKVPPVAGPFVRCSGSKCPENPLNVISLGSGPSNVLSTMLALATAMSLLAVAIVIGRRAANSTRLQRLSLAPLFSWTVLATLGYGFYVSVRAVDQHAPLLMPVAVVVAAIIAAMPLAISVGIARGHVFEMGALEQMIAKLGYASSLRALQHTMSRTFADPTLQLLLWRPSLQRYVDIDERAVEVSAINPGRKVTTFSHMDGDIVAVVHDPVLSDDVLDAAGSAIRLALHNTRLQRDLHTSISQLDASRKRLAWAADEERRRIERDLHDGAQQGLIALRIKLQLLEEGAAEDPESVVPGLADAGRRIDVALERIRSLAKGIYPSVLRDFGLSPALTAAIRELSIPVALHADLRHRFQSEVETAVYFCCVEALQNVAKHCGAATQVDLALSEEPGGLRFVLADDGPGFDPARIGTMHGITGMRDRLEAIGGELTIRSSRGAGTTITGRVPTLAA